MSDFDFDELDKAVSSALGGSDELQKEAAQRSEPQPQSQPESQPESEPTSEPRRATPPPAARRGPSGRFMDMVHPSSDMRTKTATDTASGTSSASSTNSVVTDTTTASSRAGVVSAGLPKPPVFTDFNTRQSNGGAKTSPSDWSKPLESPFLPDAKVEKRPLGGEPAPEELLLEAPDDPRLEAINLPDPIDFAAASTDINEDDAISASAEFSNTKPEVEAKEASVEPEDSDLPEVSELAEVPELRETTEEPAEDIPVGPTSITQQYKEQSSSETVSGAIYDTETYHQPLTPPVKKRSGAWVVLWIFLLVALGAGAGAAFYLYVLPLI